MFSNASSVWQIHYLHYNTSKRERIVIKAIVRNLTNVMAFRYKFPSDSNAA